MAQPKPFPRLEKKRLLESIAYDLEGTVQQAIEYLQRRLAAYPEDRREKVFLSMEEDQWEDHPRLYLCVYEPETDQEYEDRLQQNHTLYAKVELIERAQLAALKKKYEG